MTFMHGLKHYIPEKEEEPEGLELTEDKEIDPFDEIVRDINSCQRRRDRQ